MKNRIFTCDVGDLVIYDGKKVYVSEVISDGKENAKKNGQEVQGVRSEIAVCRVMPDNGQILHRSPRFIGSNWEHLGKGRNCR